MTVGALARRVPAWWSVVSLAAIVAATAGLRLRLLDVPLDRDEGEYAYMGQLLLQGVPPYARAYNMKMPGTSGAYALILALFGQSPAAIHAGLLVANAIAIVLVFSLARRLFDPAVAVAAAAAFAALSVSPQLLGLAAYAEHFVLVAALASVLLLLRALDTGRSSLLFLAGALSGLAFVIKQSGGLFAAFAVVYAVAVTRPLTIRAAVRPAGILLAGAALPFAALCLALILAGTFESFWFWTFRYAAEYGGSVTLRKGLSNLLRTSRDVLGSAGLVVASALIGVSACFWHPPLRRRRSFMVLLFVCSFAAVSVGLYFRHQYFLLLAPALALGAGLTPVVLARLVAARWPVALLAGAVVLAVLPIAHALHAERFVLFRATPLAASRTIYGRNPFPESLEIARYIRERTSSTDRIGVIGSEPQIYFYAERPAATGFIYMYPLMERHPYAAGMQAQMIREIEAARPKFLVFVNVSVSWLATTQSEPALARWFADYWRNFEQVGVIDIVSPDTTFYLWDDAATGYRPRSTTWLSVFRRRTEMPVPAAAPGAGDAAGPPPGGLAR